MIHEHHETRDDEHLLNFLASLHLVARIILDIASSGSPIGLMFTWVMVMLDPRPLL